MIDIIYRFAPDYRLQRPTPKTPTEARLRLEEGNRLFAELIEAEERGQAHEPRVIPFDLRDLGISEVEGVAPGQSPFAAVLGCSDARAPTELIFSQGCNDLFVVRVAGNVLGNECLGSLDYAVQHLRASLKLLVVMGHSHCGALAAAVDSFIDPTKYLAMAANHALRTLVDRLMVPVRASAQGLEAVWGNDVSKRPGFRAALIETSVFQNAALAAYTLDKEAHEHGGTGFEVVFGVYDLVHRRVGLPSSQSSSPDGWDWGLATPPASMPDFIRLSKQVAASNLVRSLLSPDGNRSNP
jgi:carbonic anhydrase